MSKSGGACKSRLADVEARQRRWRNAGGGVATDRFDAFRALIHWVERGEAPERLIARAGPASLWPGRERPLCPYPKVARYPGSGSPELAASFVCR